MDKLIKLATGFVAGTFIGFLGGVELFGGEITKVVLHDAALLTLVTAGMCAVAIPIVRKVSDL